MKCEEAGHVCDKNQYKEASFWDRFRLNIHLLYCSACRKYVSRNQKLTETLKNSNLKTMPQDDKNALKEKLHQEMSK